MVGFEAMPESRAEHEIAHHGPAERRAPILLVGEAPNPATQGKPHRWLRPDASGKPHSANRLLEHLGPGWTVERYLETFDRTNVLDYYPGDAPGGGALFPMREALLLAARLSLLMHDGIEPTWKLVVVLGKRAARAFEWSGRGGPAGPSAAERRRIVPPYFELSLVACHPTMSDYVESGVASFAAPAVVIPHPSGLNRWWNDPTNVWWNDPANVERFREMTRGW